MGFLHTHLGTCGFVLPFPFGVFLKGDALIACLAIAGILVSRICFLVKAIGFLWRLKQLRTVIFDAFGNFLPVVGFAFGALNYDGFDALLQKPGA